MDVQLFAQLVLGYLVAGWIVMSILLKNNPSTIFEKVFVVVLAPFFGIAVIVFALALITIIAALIKLALAI